MLTPAGHVLPGGATKAMKKARQLAEKAIQIAPAIADGYVALGAAIVGSPERICRLPDKVGIMSACISKDEREQALKALEAPFEMERGLLAHTVKGGKGKKKATPPPPKTQADQVWRNERETATNLRRLGQLLDLDGNTNEAAAAFQRANQLAAPQKGDPDYDHAWYRDLHKRAYKQRPGARPGDLAGLGIGDSRYE